MDDPHLGLDEYHRVAGPAADDADLTIGVTHAPYQRVLDAMVGDGAGLVLAGHTHGGQVCVPGWGALTTNCDLDAGRVKGVSRWWPGASGVDSTQAVPIGPGALATDGSPLDSAAEIGERFDVLDAHRVHNDSVSRSEATARERRRTALPSSAAPDDAAWLHVSAGLGHNKYTPVRFACRPEATLITLTAKAH